MWNNIIAIFISLYLLYRGFEHCSIQRTTKLYETF